MGPYQLLVSISVEHTYFPGSVCSGLEFTLPSPTASLMNRGGLLVRGTANGVRLFADEEWRRFFDSAATAGEPPPDLLFKVFVRDPCFGVYTAPPWRKDGALLYLDGRDAVREESGRFRLHTGEYVAPRDFQRLDDPSLAHLIEPRDRAMPPLCVIRLRGEQGVQGAWYLRFKARETYWKYYILGELARRDLAIVDRDGAVEFEHRGEEALPDGRRAAVFRSTLPIPLRQSSGCWFQLRELQGDSGRTLIRRLPVAPAGRMDRETIDGNEAAVSELFINS